MFLEKVKERNPRLIEAAFAFHQKGVISPNTYVLDLETIRQNTEILAEAAREKEIELFFMTKQFGRNPIVAKAIVEAGIERAVAVDPWEALKLSKHGIQLGHVGHLVQIPKRMLPEILDLNPEYITVFSLENAQHVNEAAKRQRKKQNIFLRIADNGNFIYQGQEGGFTLHQLAADIVNIKDLDYVQVAGLTSFPCILIKDGLVTTTSNVESMKKARVILEKHGYNNVQMNMPSATSAASLQTLKDNGATQGEPGHALTGTTPLHRATDQPERPAMVYVSEVSHKGNDCAYVFGGGFYPRSHMKHALVGSTIDQLKQVPIIENDPTNIDYYGMLNTTEVNVGDTAIFAFRTQIFVTHAHIAIVDHVSTEPKLIGIYDAVGNQIK